MRSWIVGLASVTALAGLASSGCSGGDGDGGGGAGGTTFTVPTDCTSITIEPFELIAGITGSDGWYGGMTSPALGGDADDYGDFILVGDPELTGLIDLGAGVQANYSTCTACVTVDEDVDDSGESARTYFQAAGTVDLGQTMLLPIAGSFSNVTLVEVTIDPDTWVSTPVADGACLLIESQSFDVEAPPEEWICDAMYYDGGDDDGCDCECGIVDPDCSLEGTDVYNCYEGQTCSADGHCEGAPAEWTCDLATFNAADGCHCGCGAADPDCDLDGAEVIGCDSGESCPNGACVPAAWTCDGVYFTDGMYCDCECGLPDPDCTNAELPVYGCDDEQDTGVCLADGTCEQAG